MCFVLSLVIETFTAKPVFSLLRQYGETTSINMASVNQLLKYCVAELCVLCRSWSLHPDYLQGRLITWCTTSYWPKATKADTWNMTIQLPSPLYKNEAISEIPIPLTFETYIAELARLPSFFLTTNSGVFISLSVYTSFLSLNSICMCIVWDCGFYEKV